MSDINDDNVKKIFGKTAKEMLSAEPSDHSKFHSVNAFCGNAGKEEMKHLQSLLDTLSYPEIARLTDAVGIHFGGPAREVDRETLEGVLDEADREDFYREYHAIIAIRNSIE